MAGLCIRAAKSHLKGAGTGGWGSGPPSAPGTLRSEKAMSRQDQNTFLYGSNATFIAELYSRYLEDPASVDESWRSFFAELAEQAPDVLKELDGPGWGRERSHVIANGHAEAASGNGHAAAAMPEAPVAAPGRRREQHQAGARAAQRDPGANRGAAHPDQVPPRGQAPPPAALARARGARALPRPPLHRRQALRPRRRRVAHPRARAGDQAR